MPADTKPFSFPRDHAFPPFYSLQPNSSTLHAQQEKWGSLILSYCRAHRIFKLSLVDAISWDLFYNKAIEKRLSLADAREMIDFLRREGRAEWVGTGREIAWVWWRNDEEWAEAIADWVDETGQRNTVLTLYELTESEATLAQGDNAFHLISLAASLKRAEFHGMDADVLQRALNVLVRRGKAQVFGQEDQQGVKFF